MYLNLFYDRFLFFLKSYAKKDTQLREESPIHKIRITLTSRNVKSLEKGNNNVWLTFVECALSKNGCLSGQKVIILMVTDFKWCSQ